jgi:beta-ribofuranosylaminobenzene 5'-phosphate synthase
VSTSQTAFRVGAAARLHLGFLDPGATLGRRFGSIGLAIDGLATRVLAAPHDALLVTGAEQSRAATLAARVLEHYGLPARARIEIEEAIPGHAGLGSGTQLALAIGSALTALHGRATTGAELAAALGRGRRSGIGLALFEQGGIVVDAGHGTSTITPPAVSRLAFPEDWPIVLVFDHGCEGLSGGAERRAFDELEPLPRAAAAHLCHLTLMRILPAVVERDFASFAAGIGELQAVVGDHFAAVQAGRYTSARVSRAIEMLSSRLALRGVGQSSWGPTAFAFAPDTTTADAALALLREQFGTDNGLEFRACRARNSGATRVPAPLTLTRRRANA